MWKAFSISCRTMKTYSLTEDNCAGTSLPPPDGKRGEELCNRLSASGRSVRQVAEAPLRPHSAAFRQQKTRRHWPDVSTSRQRGALLIDGIDGRKNGNKKGQAQNTACLTCLLACLLACLLSVYAPIINVKPPVVNILLIPDTSPTGPAFPPRQRENVTVDPFPHCQAAHNNACNISIITAALPFVNWLYS